MKKELRSFEGTAELRQEDDGNYIEGYAIVFNRESRDLGGFTEVIDPGALEGADVSDIMARYNHSTLIGRSTSGTLSYDVDQFGVKYRIKLPNSDIGNHLRELVGRGDITGSSFAFRIAKDGENWERRDGKPMLRTVTKFAGIYDMGPVDSPAYLDTTAAKRHMDELTEKEKEEARIKEEIRKNTADYMRKRLRMREIGDDILNDI